MNQIPRYLPAEWHPQSAVHLTWPHAGTDWASILEETVICFINLAESIADHQKLIIVCQNIDEVKSHLQNCPEENLCFIQLDSNDTWARDHGALTVLEDGKPILLDFSFNGWGGKFVADKDNRITRGMWDKGLFKESCLYKNHLNFILEGGAIESDGKGTLLTTSQCLLHSNRNPGLSRPEIENYLKSSLGVKRILWLDQGYLIGDDTDSHIDTLARFCGENTIAYVKCKDEDDPHFGGLQLMEEQLKTFKTNRGEPYQLVPLPMAEPVYFDKKRLPVTYANFLITNEKVLVPFYDTRSDLAAQKVIMELFPRRQVVGIDCQVLIRQHGSLHCVTMQYPKGVI